MIFPRKCVSLKVDDNRLNLKNMKTLTIRNFGPLKEAAIEMGRMNLIIGLQSSGKSCVMMVACYCSWVEKRIALRQSVKEFKDGSYFLDMMTAYYHSKGYVHKDTYIKYESEFMEFSYDQAEKSFSHRWKRLHWRYKRPKVSYVPAERNMVSLVSNWSRLETSYDNILDFKDDWDSARKFMKKEHNILETGISYEYDDISGGDNIVTSNGKRLELANSSSGMQSLVPQVVHLDYLSKGIYAAEKMETDKTYATRQLMNNLLDILYKRNYGKDKGNNMYEDPIVVHLEGKDYTFRTRLVANKFAKEAGFLMNTDHAEVFLEEPESNLFPPTQFQLMNMIKEIGTDKKHKNFFFIATHSPYVLSYLLQENLKDFKLFLTYPAGEGYFYVKTATKDDIQQIYDNGSDAFFNFEAFTN